MDSCASHDRLALDKYPSTSDHDHDACSPNNDLHGSTTSPTHSHTDEATKFGECNTSSSELNDDHSRTARTNGRANRSRYIDGHDSHRRGGLL